MSVAPWALLVITAVLLFRSASRVIKLERRVKEIEAYPRDQIVNPGGKP